MREGETIVEENDIRREERDRRQDREERERQGVTGEVFTFQ